MIRGRFRRWGASVVFAVAASLAVPAAGARDVTVAITAIVEHTALDTVRDGIRDALAAAGYIVGQNLNILYETADADSAKATAIARRFAAARPDVVVAISAQTAKAVIGEVKNLPVVITAVTQETANAILKSRRRSRNIAGRVETVPYLEQLSIVAEIAPETTVVLAPYNQRDPASRAIATKLREVDDTMDFIVRPIPVSRPSEVILRLRELIAPNMAIFLPDDTTMDMPVEEIAALAAEFGLPVIAGSAEAVARGALATVVYDPYTVGWQAGEAVSRILDGAKPRDVAIRRANATHLILNKQAAEDSGIELRAELLDRAGTVLE